MSAATLAPSRLAEVLRPFADMLGDAQFIGRHEDGQAENGADGSRWYTDPYRPGRRYLSVTWTIDSTESAPWRMPWAGTIAAEVVVDNWSELGALMRAHNGPQLALKWLKGEADRQRKLAMAVGSWQHDALEALITPGKAIPDPPEWMLGRMLRNGGERILITRESLDSWADGLLAFLTQYRAQVVMSEATIANPELGYATRVDLVVWCPGIGLVLIDLKTGRVSRYVRMQMAAMLRAPEVWIPGGGRIDMPACDEVAVLHLRPRYEYGFKLIKLDADEVEQGWDEFQAATTLVKTRERSGEYERSVLYPPEFSPSGEVVRIPTVPMVEDSGLRCRSALRAAGLTWIHELAEFTQADVRAIRGVGPKAIDDLRVLLHQHGLAFAGEQMRGAAA